MAIKTIYKPQKKDIGVNLIRVEYKYFSGFALSQKQKCIQSLHDSAIKSGEVKSILEVSSKSMDEIGIKLSAFNLKYDGIHSVEQIFQSSKVFEKGGPFLDLLNKTSHDAKTDERLKTSGNIINFNFQNIIFPTRPYTFFYDWLYINALLNFDDIYPKIKKYDSFSDIEFNEKKSINCQAYSLALFSSIISNIPASEIYKLKDKDFFLSVCSKEYSKVDSAMSNMRISRK